MALTADSYQYGVVYDYDSIMHYSSTDFGKTDDAGQLELVLVKHPSRVEQGETNMIYQGGAEDLALKSISTLDVVRVSQLYPSSEQIQQALRDLQRDGWKECPFTIPGKFTTTVKQAPTGH